VETNESPYIYIYIQSYMAAQSFNKLTWYQCAKNIYFLIMCEALVIIEIEIDSINFVVLQFCSIIIKIGKSYYING